MEKFSSWLERELAEHKLKQADLVRASGLDSAVISNIMNGKRNVGEKTARAIARALKLSEAEVFQAAGIMTPNPRSDLVTEEGANILRQMEEDKKKEAVRLLRYYFDATRKKP